MYSVLKSDGKTVEYEGLRLIVARALIRGTDRVIRYSPKEKKKYEESKND